MFQGIYEDNNSNEEAKAMIFKIKKEKQRSLATAKERWGGKLGGAAAPVNSYDPHMTSSNQQPPSLRARILLSFREYIKGISWPGMKIFVSENIEYIVGAFFALVAVGVFYHICDRILYQMPSRD